MFFPCTGGKEEEEEGEAEGPRAAGGGGKRKAKQLPKGRRHERAAAPETGKPQTIGILYANIVFCLMHAECAFQEAAGPSSMAPRGESDLSGHDKNGCAVYYVRLWVQHPLEDNFLMYLSDPQRLGRTYVGGS